MDSLTETQWKEVARRYDALDPAARNAAWDAARYAARYAAMSAAGYAARELMGDIENPVFVPLFDNLDA